MRNPPAARFPNAFRLQCQSALVPGAIAFAMILGASEGRSQTASATCGLSDVSESTPLEYPPIAKAAHVSGQVILIASFADSGAVTAIKVVSGPQMLVGRATEYVQGWRVNTAAGVRSCPVVIRFRTLGDAYECGTKPPPATPGFVPVQRIDPQHVTITYDRSQNCYSVCY